MGKLLKTILIYFYRRKALNINIGWIFKIIINILDFYIFYYLCNNIVKKRPKLSVKIIFVGISYGVAIGGVLANIVDGNVARAIITVILILMFKFITKKKLPDVLIIFAITYLCIVLIQILCLQLINILRISENYSFLLVEILTSIVVMFIYIKIPLYKLYNTIEKEILLKLSIFILAGMLLLTLFYYNFEYTSSYILCFSLLITVTFFCLFQTLKRIFFYTNKIPIQLHDMKNLMMGIQISAHSTSDANVIRNEIDKILEIIDIGMSDINFNIDDYSQNVLSFINLKKSKVEYDKLTFLTDIGYYEPHAKVSFSVILYMLGVLLDNAIESGTKKAIIVKVYVIEESLYLSVSNEYNKKSTDDFNKMFQERYSTKEETHSRGYGLSNLSKVVADYDGKILLQEEYNTEQKSNHITIAVEIKR